MFRALLAHPQELLYKRHLVSCVRIMSVGGGTVSVKLQPCHSQLTLCVRSIPNAVCAKPPKGEQVLVETCRGLWFSINWMKSASRWFHYTDTLWCTVNKTLRHTVVECSSRRFKWVSNYLIFFLWRCDPTRATTSTVLMFLDHTQRRATVGRTPLDEWSAGRRDLYLTTHKAHNRQISMPPVGFEPKIPGSERPQTNARPEFLVLRVNDFVQCIDQRNQELFWSYDPWQSGNIFLQNLDNHITGYTLSYPGTSIFTAVKIPNLLRHLLSCLFWSVNDTLEDSPTSKTRNVGMSEYKATTAYVIISDLQTRPCLQVL
jgi:hypothetical protein